MTVKIKILTEQKDTNTLLTEQWWRLRRTGKWLRGPNRQSIRQAMRQLTDGVKKLRAGAKFKDDFDSFLARVGNLSTESRRANALMRKIVKDRIIRGLTEIDEVFKKLKGLKPKDLDKVDVEFVLRQRQRLVDLQENMTARLEKLDELKDAGKIKDPFYSTTKKNLSEALTKIDESIDIVDEGIDAVKAPKAFWVKMGIGTGVLALAGTYGLIAFKEADAEDEDTEEKKDDDKKEEEKEETDAPGDCAMFNRVAKRTLKLPVKDATIKIQKRLKALGYKVTVDGKCSDALRAAVAKFQQVMIEKHNKDLGTTGPRRNGVDGIVGPKTWPLLQQDFGKNPDAEDKDKEDKEQKEKEKDGKKSGDCFDQEKFKSMDSLGKLNCAWDNRQYMQIARTYNRLRKMLEIPVGNVLYPDGDIPKGTGGFLGMGAEESGFSIIRRAINQQNMAPMPQETDPHQAALFMVNKLKSIVVSSTSTVEIQMRDTSGESRQIFSYKFPWSSVIQDLEDAITREIKPWKNRSGEGTQDHSEPDKKKVKKKVKKKDEKKVEKKGIIAQLAEGELVGAPAQKITIGGKETTMQFKDSIQLAYDGGTYNFIFVPNIALKLGGAKKQAATIKSAQKSGAKLVVVLEADIGAAGKQEQTYNLSDKDLQSLLAQTANMSKGQEKEVTIAGKEGTVKKVNESKRYDLDFSRWEKMFK